MFTDLLLTFLRSLFNKNFKMIRKLGSGSFGSVHLVERRSNKRLYVSKFIKKKQVTQYKDTPDGERVPMEIYNMTNLDHHNVVELHGYLELPKEWVLIMEYSRHYCDVRQYIRQYGRMSEDLGRHVYVQVLSAVQYCFVKGIHHRDVKDQNILINKETGHVKLIDFGSSCVGPLNEPYINCSGTLLYLPPEYFLYHSYMPLDSTVWALGCLLYIILVGKGPFTTVDQILRVGLDIPSHLTLECKYFLLHSLRKKHTKRLRFADINRHLWIRNFKGFNLVDF